MGNALYAAVKLSAKGQVSIPKLIRDRLALEPGGRVVFRVEGEHVVIEPVGNLVDWYGALEIEGPLDDWREVRTQVRCEIGRHTASEGEVVADEPIDARR